MRLFRRAKPPSVTPTPADPDIESQTQSIGRDLLDLAHSAGGGLLSSRFWSDQLMTWSMKDPAFKTELFRFVDVMPALRSPERIHQHLTEYLARDGVTPPPFLKLGLSAGGIMKGTLAKTVTSQVEAMAARFVAGVDARDALPALRKLWEDDGAAFSVDLLGEACVSDAEALEYQRRYLDLIEHLPAAVADFPERPTLEADHLGPVPRCNVSIKISSLSPRIKPADFEGSVRTLHDALTPILRAASERGVFVNFDMEQHALKDLTIALFKRCVESVDFPAGLAMQAYLRSGDADAENLIAWAKSTGKRVTVRLIKGAYWDYETAHADQMNWPSPVWTAKADTDACFERMTDRFVAQTPKTRGEPGVKLAIGSHNLRSIAHAIAVANHHGLSRNALEFQMLRGMADELKGALVARGYRVREYVPVGQMIPGMAYLVRRLLENTSNESWLRAGFSDGADPAALLAPPRAVDAPAVEPDRAERHQLSAAFSEVGDGRPFLNEPLRDFSDTAQRERFAQTIAARLTPSPGTPGEGAGIEDVDATVARAHAAFPAWRDTPIEQRARVLIQAAQLMRSRRDELAGVVIRESGKPWAEADADVCEAIDFCEFYARQAVELARPLRLGRFAGEENLLWHEGRGVAVVISPWNFPLAICCGMTAAALVTGNTVIVKPAEQTPVIARVLCEILRDAGAPRDVLHYLPGQGETVGAALVRHPRVAVIAFTGSKAVGLDIIRAAGTTDEQQTFVKRVVCEMGGKNAILVDSSADVDEAVLGMRQSAFSYAGQKCSAASRCIVLDDAWETFVRRLIESTRALIIGDPLDPATDVGPVIDTEAAEKIRRFIEIGKSEAKLELAMEVPGASELERRGGKPFVGPHIFSIDRMPPAPPRIAAEEIFGPVLTVIRARDLDEAIALVNNSVYKLTGGVFSRTPSTIERVRREFRVGNLYINRSITGALVGRQPFGGFGLSGVGSKAGGRDYLRQFVDPRVATENTLRRGFAPQEIPDGRPTLSGAGGPSDRS